ncbi:unnamed protein product [Amoebophrya sp. A120]|nr:unnamed protein product [Amoebophrya sp. A120]|eukprot:GSA120T00003456001.1
MLDLIVPHLHLGTIETASDPEVLRQYQIVAVVCCCPYTEFLVTEEQADIKYFRVDVEDQSREPIHLYFEEAHDFIHSFTSKEESVFVHCRAGVSRSATVVISYLMAKLNYTLHDAFFLVRSRRAAITPNLGFMEQLCEFEEKNFREPTIDMWKYTEWYMSSEDHRTGVPDIAPDY